MFIFSSLPMTLCGKALRENFSAKRASSVEKVNFRAQYTFELTILTLFLGIKYLVILVVYCIDRVVKNTTGPLRVSRIR